MEEHSQFLESIEKLHHSLGRPSRSDYVQLEFVWEVWQQIIEEQAQTGIETLSLRVETIMGLLAVPVSFGIKDILHI